MSRIDPLTEALKKVTSRLLNLLPGPPSDENPPDVDGHRDSDLDYDRAALDAKMQDQVGPGGTPG